MRAWRQETVNVLPGAVEREIKSGVFSGILLRWWGDAEALATPVLGDLGNILVRFRGRAIANIRVSELWMRTHLRGGRPEAVANVGADFAFSVVLPFRYGQLSTYNSDDNVLNVRNNELHILFDGVDPAIFTTCFVDVVPLMDVGAARYIPNIGSQLYEYTGQDRIRLSVPNIRELLIQQPQNAIALADSILLTSDGRVLNEANWAEYLALTDIDSMVELGAAATGYIMPDLGNRNPATWARGRYELLMVGVTASATSFIVEFGAEPVSSAEFDAVNAQQIAMIADGMASSSLPPTADVAPISNAQIITPYLNYRGQAAETSSVPANREEVQQRAARVPVGAVQRPGLFNRAY